MAILPEGVEATLHIYLTSPSLELDCVVSLEGNAQIPAPEEINAKALAKSINAPNAPDWRVMTRAEIAAYKADDDEAATEGGA